ncbi:MAG: hypothetical protein U0930_04030 [Pirellulales bacterium]
MSFQAIAHPRYPEPQQLFEPQDKWKLESASSSQQLENTIKSYNGIQIAIVNYDQQRAGFGKKSDQVAIAVQG